MQKLLRVSGDRVWGAGGPSAPEPFTRMPLVYERAFGGVDRQVARSRSATGTGAIRSARGFAVTRDNLDGVPLPNIEYPDELIASWDDRPRPAGFGADRQPLAAARRRSPAPTTTRG